MVLKYVGNFPQRIGTPLQSTKTLKSYAKLAVFTGNLVPGCTMAIVQFASIEEFIPRCKKVGEVKGEPIKHFFG